jgi:transcriptional regulator with XRE-family HTH domain
MSIKNNSDDANTWKKRFAIVAARIREIHHPRVMSDAACAKFLGVSSSLWSQWQIGTTKNPKAHQVRQISEKTGFNEQWLISGKGEPMGGTVQKLNETASVYGEGGLESVLGKVCTIMTSKTVYATALAANVDAFHAAVLQGREKSQLEERIEILEEQLEKVVAASHCGNSQEDEVAIGKAG